MTEMRRLAAHSTSTSNVAYWQILLQKSVEKGREP
jgi:hypothetical protein